MADPVATELTGGLGTAATTTASFSAQAAGTLLLLHVASDDYRTTSGSGRPESTGWTFLLGQEGNLGFYVWYKLAGGAETSVQYTIGSATKSAYAVTAVTNIDQGTPLGANNTNMTGVAVSSNPWTTPSITPTAGSRWISVATGGTTGNATAGPYTESNSYVEVHERYNTAGYRPGLAAATLVLNGGSATSTTFTPTGQSDQRATIIAAWKNAAGLTQVTAARATTWATLAPITSTRQTAWTTRAWLASASTRVTSWTVLVPIAAPSTRQTTWATKAQVTSTRQTTWATIGQVTSTRQTTWKTLAPVTSTRATTWAALAPVTSIRATQWAVLTVVSASTRATQWAVLTTTMSTRATTWATVAPVTSTRSETWRVLAAVTSTRGETWTTLKQITSTRAETWAVEGTTSQVTSSRQTAWTTLATVTSTQQTAWAALTPVTSTRQTAWVTRSQTTSSRATLWATRTAVTSTRATQWAVIGQITSTRATQWEVFANLIQVTSTRATTWEVIGQISSTSQTTWTTLAQVSSTRQTQWTVVRQVTASREERWNTLGVVADSRETIWSVLTSVPSVTRATEWAVLSQVLSQRHTEWAVFSLAIPDLDRAYATGYLFTTDRASGSLLLRRPATGTITHRPRDRSITAMTATCVVTHPDIGPYEKLYIDLFATEMTFDTAGTMVVLRIGATVYSMNWVGAPDVMTDGTRQQYARSSAMFCGSAVVPLPGDVQLTAGRYIGWPVITLTNGQQVQLPPSPIDVR